MSTVYEHPFGRPRRFGNVAFNSTATSLSVNQDWITTPVSIIDAAFPIDPYGSLGVMPMGQKKATFDYGIMVNATLGKPTWGLLFDSGDPSITHPIPSPATDVLVESFKTQAEIAQTDFGASPIVAGNSPLSALEFQWNELYIGLRQFNNQSTILEVNRLDSGNPYVAQLGGLNLDANASDNTNVAPSATLSARARIEDISLKLTPGQATSAITTTMDFTLLSDWEDIDPDATITSRILNKRKPTYHVPFGNVVGFAGFTFPTPNPSNWRAPFMASSIITDYQVVWDTQYSVVSHSAFPLDHLGVNPARIKAIDAGWELYFMTNAESITGEAYYQIYTMYNQFLSWLRSGHTGGQLTVKDANGNLGSCRARIKSFPYTVTPQNSNYLTVKVVFELYSDWTYTTSTASYR